MIGIKAPHRFNGLTKPCVFLAGSIEMGAAEDWQARLTIELSDVDCVVLNPRRDDWDSSWEQTIDNEQFREQVEWELTAMQHANVIAMHFEPGTKSPITLLELGLHAASDRLVVHCPEGYWRKGNVDVVCRRYHVQQAASLKALVAQVRAKLDAQTETTRPPKPPKETKP